MNQDAKYLRLTLHDNDFEFELSFVAKLLYDIFEFYDYPTEDDLSRLQRSIRTLIYQVYDISHLILEQNGTDWSFELPYPTLEFVNYLDIPNWDNYESVYIPMFDDAEIIVR